MILGIDEVGRGPWAGPLVIGAVVLGGEIEGLTDSKKLSAARRKQLSAEIHEKAAAVGLGWVHADEIDAVGLGKALQLACERAVKEVDKQGVAYHEIIIDGTINLLKDTAKGAFVTTLKKADLLIPSVSAASIVAKVARDEYMAAQDDEYPEYGFATHVGYGTAKHRAAIDKHGVTPLHRLSFAPLVKYAPSVNPDVAPQNVTHALLSPTTKQVGDRAEEVVAEYLQADGHEVIDRNWKTKFCEIDIVSRKNNCVYFTEVKYRKTDRAGGGMAAMTPKKLTQMKFSAEYLALKHKLTNVSLCLAAAEVTGQEFRLIQWLEIR